MKILRLMSFVIIGFLSLTTNSLYAIDNTRDGVYQHISSENLDIENLKPDEMENLTPDEYAKLLEKAIISQDKAAINAILKQAEHLDNISGSKQYTSIAADTITQKTSFLTGGALSSNEIADIIKLDHPTIASAIITATAASATSSSETFVSRSVTATPAPMPVIAGGSGGISKDVSKVVSPAKK